MTGRRLAAAVAGGLPLVVAVLQAAPGGEPAATLPRTGPADTLPSGEVPERLRERQRDLEWMRRWRLPRTSGGPAPPCDERVGRWCYWHEDDPDFQPQPEPAAVRRAREDLIDELSRARGRRPRSDWIVGQLVRYEVEAGRPAEALETARACRASPAWCAALAGYAHHAAGRHRRADSAFAAALSLMEPARRCRWRDLSPVLEGPAADRYARLGCGERRAFERSLWWLSDPLYLVPGNDRRAEHYARRVLDRMQRDAASPFGERWGPDLRELLLRYGWPRGWRRVARPPSRPGAEARVVAYDPWPSHHFLPRARAVARPGEAAAGDWRLDAHHPRTRHAPGYADSFGPLLHAVSVFRRGDSARIVAAYRMRGDTLPPRPPVEAVLYLGRERGASETRAGPVTGGPAGVLQARVPAEPHLLGLEALSRSTARAERARYGLDLSPRPEGAPGISDLLLWRPPPGEDAAEATGRADPLLDRLAPRALPSRTVRPGQRLGLYWETYGPGLLFRSHTVSVRLRREDGGWLRRLAEDLRLTEPRTPGARIRWRGAAEPGRRVRPRRLVVTLPAAVPDGELLLEVVVRLPGRKPLRAARELQVERRDP